LELIRGKLTVFGPPSIYAYVVCTYVYKKITHSFAYIEYDYTMIAAMSYYPIYVTVSILCLRDGSISLLVMNSIFYPDIIAAISILIL